MGPRPVDANQGCQSVAWLATRRGGPQSFQIPMRTPAGKECKYFYGDYFRGRSTEECRLLLAARESWSPDLCRTCPVPDVLRANACEFLQLRGSVTRPVGAAFRRRVRITAFCEKVGKPVPEPEIGCGECHPLPPEFVVKS